MKKRLIAGLLAMTLVFSDASMTLAKEYVETNTYEETEDYDVSLLEDTITNEVTVTAQAGVGVSAVGLAADSTTASSNLSNGNTKESIKIEAGTYASFNATVKPGYNWFGWCWSSDSNRHSGTKDLREIINDSLTYYAVASPNTYYVSYNANSSNATGSMNSSTMTYDKSSTLSKNTFVNDGYEFVGWNTKADGSGAWYSDEEEVSNLTTSNYGTVKLYAQWEEQLTDDLVSNGASAIPGGWEGVPVTVSNNQKCKSNGHIMTLVNPDEVYKLLNTQDNLVEGTTSKCEIMCTMCGTGLSASNTDFVIKDGVISGVNCKIAKVEGNPKGDGSVICTIEYDSRTVINARGQYKTSGSKEEIFKYIICDTHILDADKNVVSFKLNAPENISLNTDDAIPTGIIVDGVEEKTNSVALLADDELTNNGGSETVLKEKTVTLKRDSSSKYEPDSLEADTIIVYYIDQNNTHKIAKCDILPECKNTLKYNLNYTGATNNINDQVVKFSQKKVKPSVELNATTPTRAGYKFKGWSTDAAGTDVISSVNGKYVFDGLVKSLDQDVSIYAQWTAASIDLGATSGSTCTGKNLSVSVSNSATGSVTVASSDSTVATAALNSTGDLLTVTPKKIGTATITLTNSAGSKATYAVTVTTHQLLAEKTKPNNGIVDGRKWQTCNICKKEFFTKYLVNLGYDSTSVASVTSGINNTYHSSGDDITITVTTKTGYSNPTASYKINGVEYKATTDAADSSKLHITMPSNAISVWASASANKYYIKYDANGGSGSMTNTTATYNKNATLASNSFTRSGYEFIGWNTKQDGSGTSYANNASVTNLTAIKDATVTLYAQWKVNKADQVISVNPETLEIYVGEEKTSTISGVKTTPNAYPESGDYSIIEAVSFSATASVLRGVKVGSAVFNIFADGNDNYNISNIVKMTINVIARPSLDATAGTQCTGYTKVITVNDVPTGASISATSGDESIAKVKSISGNKVTVSFVKAGTTNISVKVVAANHEDVNLTYKATVRNHNWGTPSYTWEKDYSKCTGSATCSLDSTHKVTNAVTTTKSDANGKVTFTATFTSPLASQSKLYTKPAVASGWVYDDTNHNLLSSNGTTPDGNSKIYYIVSNSSTAPAVTATGWTTTAPTGKDAKTYYVFACVKTTESTPAVVEAPHLIGSVIVSKADFVDPGLPTEVVSCVSTSKQYTLSSLPDEASIDVSYGNSSVVTASKLSSRRIIINFGSTIGSSVVQVTITADNYNTKRVFVNISTKMHNLITKKVATCTEEGVSGCTGCEYTLPISALEHDIVVIKEPACTTEGYTKCTRVDCTYNVSIPALGHRISHKDPTCTTVGYDKCTRTGCMYNVTVPPTGHNWDIKYNWSYEAEVFIPANGPGKDQCEGTAVCKKCSSEVYELVDAVTTGYSGDCTTALYRDLFADFTKEPLVDQTSKTTYRTFASEHTYVYDVELKAATKTAATIAAKHVCRWCSHINCSAEINVPVQSKSTTVTFDKSNGYEYWLNLNPKTKYCLNSGTRLSLATITAKTFDLPNYSTRIVGLGNFDGSGGFVMNSNVTKKEECWEATSGVVGLKVTAVPVATIGGRSDYCTDFGYMAIKSKVGASVTRYALVYDVETGNIGYFKFVVNTKRPSATTPKPSPEPTPDVRKCQGYCKIENATHYVSTSYCNEERCKAFAGKGLQHEYNVDSSDWRVGRVIWLCNTCSHSWNMDINCNADVQACQCTECNDN